MDSMLVTVCTLAGGQLELEIGPKGTGADLKSMIAKLWNAPAICQNLTVGLAVLEDTQLLSELQEEPNSVLMVTLVTRVDEALHGLIHGSRQTREASLEAVVKLLPRQSNPQAAEWLCVALEDVDFHQDTRAQALLLLAKIASLGHASAVNTFTKRVGDRSKVVRAAAIRGLRKMLPAGSKAVVIALGAYSRGRPVEVKLAALKAICVAWPRKDKGSGCVDVLQKFLDAPDTQVSAVVTKMLENLAERGSDYAKHAITQHQNGLRSKTPPVAEFRHSVNFHGYPVPFHMINRMGQHSRLEELEFTASAPKFYRNI